MVYIFNELTTFYNIICTIIGNKPPEQALDKTSGALNQNFSSAAAEREERIK